MPSTKLNNLDAHRVDDAAIGTTETTISHSLGRAPLEGFVIDRNANANIYRGTTTWTSSNIYLIASASVTATLIIF